MTEQLKNQYVAILEEELIPALGCTEPIAVALAAAKAKEALGCFPERMVAQLSGNVIKNVKGVIVPTTHDLRGSDAAAIVGAVGGDPAKGLEVLTSVSEQDLLETRRLLAAKVCKTELLTTKAKLHIIIRMFAGEHTSMVEIIHNHDNIVRIEKDGQALLDVPHNEEETVSMTDRSCLNIADIVDFAKHVPVEEVRVLLDRQITCNSAISKEGLTGSYGAAIGSTLLDTYGNDIKIRAKAAAAAGSDARMGGCEIPVIINSGSGNQGMTVSLPVIEYAKELGASQEKLYRALCISNLVAIHQKTKIGRLSAYCGAVSAAAGAGAGIAFLHDFTITQMEDTITNTLANVSGIVCDGAKPSCAAKIASSVDAAIMGLHMAKNAHTFRPGDGIVKDKIEETIDSVAQLAKDGMEVTDLEILKIMTE